jgi:hypothetical protein
VKAIITKPQPTARAKNYSRGAARGKRFNTECTEENRRTQRKRERSPPAAGPACSKGAGLKMTMLIASSEAEDEARVGYRAVLMGVEVAAAHGVCAQTKRPALFEGQINAATKFVGKGVL